VVYVQTPLGPQEREVVLGKFNDKMIEVQKGLQEGDEVIINPKVLLGEKAKTREEGQDAPKARSGPGNGEKDGGDKKGGKGGDKKGGKGGKGPGGPPAGPVG
jgi:HlyD family secretion protein